MFTRNFYNLLFSQLDQTTVKSSSNGSYLNCNLCDINGIYYSNFFSYYYTYVNNVYKLTLNILPNSDFFIADYDTVLQYYDSPKFVFGTGTKTTNIEDYKLDSIITTTDLSLITKKMGKFNTYTIYDMDIKNNSDKPITISEIGIIVPQQYVNDTGQITSYKVLISRDLLKEPLEIQPNEHKPFIYRIGLNI